MAADDDALQETACLLRVPANAKRLLESLDQSGRGDRQERARRAVRVVFTPHSWEDCTHWLGADRSVVKRIKRLIDDAL